MCGIQSRKFAFWPTLLLLLLLLLPLCHAVSAPFKEALNSITRSADCSEAIINKFFPTTATFTDEQFDSGDWEPEYLAAYTFLQLRRLERFTGKLEKTIQETKKHLEDIDEHLLVFKAQYPAIMSTFNRFESWTSHNRHMCYG